MKPFSVYGFLLAIVLVAIFAIGSSHETPVCACARNYMPVCASNGRTYANKCVFDCDNSGLGRSAQLRIVANTNCDDQENDDGSNDVGRSLFGELE